MTQNEAPEPPNEDPTYERYQSSEQRGKFFILLQFTAAILLYLITSRRYKDVLMYLLSSSLSLGNVSQFKWTSSLERKSMDWEKLKILHLLLQDKDESKKNQISSIPKKWFFAPLIFNNLIHVSIKRHKKWWNYSILFLPF